MKKSLALLLVVAIGLYVFYAIAQHASEREREHPDSKDCEHFECEHCGGQKWSDEFHKFRMGE